MLKYSRQREAIKTFLATRYDHPTAETVYLGIKDEFPNISLGTVYRNLALLAELGEIQKISTGTGPDRFDGRPHPHYHLAGQGFEGEVEGHFTYFFGKCPDCMKNKMSETS